jgi:hypothetical protein
LLETLFKDGELDEGAGRATPPQMMAPLTSHR